MNKWIILHNPLVYSDFEAEVKKWSDQGYKILVEMNWCDIPYIVGKVCKVLKDKGCHGIVLHQFCGGLDKVDFNDLELFMRPVE